MSQFIRTIGKCAVNGISFDLYENKDSSATIRPVKNGHTFPRASWLGFDGLEQAEAEVDQVAGEDSEGAERVQNLKNAWL